MKKMWIKKYSEEKFNRIVDEKKVNVQEALEKEKLFTLSDGIILIDKTAEQMVKKVVLDIVECYDTLSEASYGISLYDDRLLKDLYFIRF